MRIIPQTQEPVKYNGSQFSVVSSQQSAISSRLSETVSKEVHGTIYPLLEYSEQGRLLQNASSLIADR